MEATEAIELLAEYAKIGDRETISKARAAIVRLAKQDLDAALPLWTIAITLQRHYMEMCEQ